MSATSKFFQCLGDTLGNMVAEIGQAAGDVVSSTVHLVSVPVCVLGDSVEHGIKQSKRSRQKKVERHQQPLIEN